ncbi:helix-turn-helix domain-containing protein [Utexia brackfieldae]|uniref:helix-turn-helix domain-containing protein n=1 Tax=Utexia brackfieldae TaxID=3074108 RepID=UPI00370DC580
MGESNPEMKAMFGSRLAELRQAADLSVDNMASKLRIRRAIVDDIESGSIEMIPLVFLRGYVKSYAAIVQLPDEELQGYLQMIGTSRPNPALIKNYALKEQQKKHGKHILFWCLIIFSIIIVITGAFLWQDYHDSQTSVTHYKPSQRIMQELADG